MGKEQVSFVKCNLEFSGTKPWILSKGWKQFEINRNDGAITQLFNMVKNDAGFS